MDRINIPLDMGLLESDYIKIKQLPAYKKLYVLIMNLTYYKNGQKETQLEPLQDMFLKFLLRFSRHELVDIISQEENLKKAIAIISKSAFAWRQDYILCAEQQPSEAEAVESIDEIVKQFKMLLAECFIYYQLK